MSPAVEHRQKCRHNWLISFPDLAAISQGTVKKCSHLLKFKKMATLHKFKLGEKYNKNFIVFLTDQLGIV
jgi:hypothetical protein